MHFDNLEKILTQLEQQPGWEKLRLHRQLLKSWSTCVSRNIALHTRPLYISRQVLWIATSSAARAQELSFQRYTILKKLNRQLPVQLKDIRFSDSQWHQTIYSQAVSQEKPLFSLSEQQKVKPNPAIDALNSSAPKKVASPTDAKVAAQDWLKAIAQNSASFATCPLCDAPTPLGEIKRWNSCYHCVAQKWSENYRK